MALRTRHLLISMALLWLGMARARAEDFETQVLREARERSPALEQAMRQGKLAGDQQDAPAARAHYARALALAPDFDHALRRQCSVERALGHQAEAERLCRAALAADPSPRNQSALASVLATGPTGASLPEARSLLREARSRAPDLDVVAVAALDLAWALADEPSIRAGLADLRYTATDPVQLARQLARFAALLDDPARPQDKDEANRLALEAFRGAPDDFPTLGSVAQLALNVGDGALFEKASARLDHVAPQAMETHVFATLRHLNRGAWPEARGSLARARELGLPQENHDVLLAELTAREPLWLRLGPLLLRAGLAWLLGFVGLFVLGSVLSALTLRSARQLPKERTGRGHGASALLRHGYGLVLVLACAFYYVSLPVVLLAVVGGAGSIVYGFLALGRIPLQLVAVLCLGAAFTVFAVLRSLFVRTDDQDPGQRLDLSREPALRALLDEVAAKVGTRPVDAVYVTPGTQVAVFERGGFLRQLRASSERCLVLGLGVLDDMKCTEFKAVLAHEYGHFSNRDTAGGGLALTVRRSMLHMAQGLVEGGAATWYNPAWWFFRAFFAVFLRISQGASRLQEVLADRWAAFSYGSEPFVRGLTHVIERSAHFDVLTKVALVPVVEARTPLQNFYGTLRDANVPEDDVRRAVRESMDAVASPYDSHPAPAERIAWTRMLDAPEQEHDDRDVWSLFAERAELEQRMTAVVNDSLGLTLAPLPERPVIDF